MNATPASLFGRWLTSRRRGQSGRRICALLLLPALLLFRAGSAAGAQFSHSDWNALLDACVIESADGLSTAADYDCFASRREPLGAYLERLAGVEEAALRSWPAERQLAFLINAYNAWTVELILTAWPELESIRDLGSLLRSPWKKTFIPLFGREVSLDDIEHGMIREPGRFDEPRIHFAVNCASIGCPALRTEAYRGEALESQLEDQTRRFLADRSRNRLRDGRLEISSLFKWYREDFAGGWRALDSTEAFLARYSSALGLDDSQRQSLLRRDLKLVYLDYDWSLNTAD